LSDFEKLKQKFYTQIKILKIILTFLEQIKRIIKMLQNKFNPKSQIRFNFLVCFTSKWFFNKTKHFFHNFHFIKKRTALNFHFLYVNSRIECSAYCQADKSNCNIFIIDTSTGICRLGNLDQRLNSIGTQTSDHFNWDLQTWKLGSAIKQYWNSNFWYAWICRLK